MLSFEVVQDGAAIQICCDQHGMATLLGTLAQLVSQAPTHVHLRGPAAGGGELSATSPFGASALGEVIIDYSPDYADEG